MKQFLVTLAFLVISFITFGQTRTVSVGPVVGYGNSYIQNMNYNTLFNSSWNAGITLNISSREHSAFSADFLYSQEGSIYDINDGGVDVNLQYIRVPIKYAYFFGDVENDFRPKITIGPSLGFLLDENIKTKNISDNYNDPVLTDNYKNFDIGGQASLGFNYRLGDKLWLNTDLYYYQGFIDANNRNAYNANYGARVGLAFGL